MIGQEEMASKKLKSVAFWFVPERGLLRAG